MNAIKITTSGEISVITLTEPFYKCLQEVVGGYIEIVRPRGLPHPFIMIVDEEGRLKKPKPINPIGSHLYGYHEHGNPIVGDIAIAKEVEANEGLDIAPLSESEIQSALDHLAMLPTTKTEGAPK